MKITFLGATHEVTGSCTLIECGNFRFLVDCGMEQGEDIFLNQELPCNPSEIDAVLLTHAHIDHSGKLPLLYKGGFRGKIYATSATTSLCDIMLRDSAHIQEFEAEWRNRKGKRYGEEEYQPLYEMEDAINTISRFIPCHYEDQFPIAEGVTVRFTDIGHLLGSACVEIWMSEKGKEKKIVFSGDVGNKNQPIIRDPQKVADADYVVIESTYGDRSHGPRPEYIKTLAGYIQKVFDRGGNVIIPSFAVGRTQEILYFIRQIKQEGLVKGHDNFPVYVDSPLATEATGIFLQCDTDYFDDETKAIMESGVNPIYFEGLTVSVTSEDSKAINNDKRPKVILSASGMCEAGRIRHHLKHNLWRDDCMILFVGYQAIGTLGRSIYDGAETVKLFGEEIVVKAEIRHLPGISGHADMDGLIDWLEGFTDKPKKVFVNHGEDECCTNFVNTLSGRGFEAYAPFSGTIYDLSADRFVDIREGIRIEKKAAKTARARTAYTSLLESLARLNAVVKACEGMPNKDLAKLRSQIENLSEKWRR